ncbi:MAG: type IV toxin-antitoxin system AbiEi family antitoxin [Bryobacteraceae bacterium]
MKRTTGIDARVHRAVGRNRGADAIVEVETERRKHRFGAEVKTVDRFEIPAMVKAQGHALAELPVLVAPYITREVAERCRQLHLPFIDTAGNAYLEGPGLLVYVAGQARPAGLRQDKFRALNPAGLKLTFALLCRPGLLDVNYRKIADDAGVGLGTVSAAMKDLETRGFFNLETHPHFRKLLDPERMLEEWVTHYPVTLRPKLNPRRFQADSERLQETDLTQQNGYWGGEPAAEKLTQYLRPVHFTIYAREPIAKLIAATRMRADGAGNVEILDVFWNFDHEGFPDVVPPVLAYADLLAAHDGRDVEAARMIYEQRIVPTFRPAE